MCETPPVEDLLPFWGKLRNRGHLVEVDRLVATDTLLVGNWQKFRKFARIFGIKIYARV